MGINHKEHKGHKATNLQTHNSDSCLTRRVNHISGYITMYLPLFVFFVLFVAFVIFVVK